MRALHAEGNTDEGFDRAFDLLGNLGLYMASLRRHELTNPAREQRSPHEEATALGLHIGASVGMVPRFATGHLATHNAARDGRQKSFTSLARRVPLPRLQHPRHPRVQARRRRARAHRPARHLAPRRGDALRRRAPSARRRVGVQRHPLRRARRRPLLLQRASLLQAVPRGAPGVPRRERRRLLGHQRDRPSARPLPRQRPLLLTTARREDAVHAARGPGQPARHDAPPQLPRPVPRLPRDERRTGMVPAQRRPPSSRCAAPTGALPPSTTTSSWRASSRRRRARSTRSTWPR